MAAKLRLTLRRSVVGTNPSARGTVRALGLHRIGHTVELSDDDATRGQVRAVRYLLDVEEVAAPAADKAAPAKSRAAPAADKAAPAKSRAAPAKGRAAPASRKEEAQS
ncbi:MAG TPA: 50S ribosomal protein L30 [Candidatus Limnocylindrales bacterium]|nr:50S ribosomal protein L30 [Candidatus Limnocylindrales bacterium]